jgi:hypothetical protein
VVDNDALQISTHCPFSYCKPNRKDIKLNSSDTHVQCASRASCQDFMRWL